MSGHNNQKKVAIINDFSGFGRCSIAVALPIISTLKIQCCPVPTAVFSNHTAFDSFYFSDFTDHMEAYIAEWKKLDLHFQGISSGFLGSKKQIEIVKSFIKAFKKADTTVVIDPVMGDNGNPYATYTKEMCQEMKKLVSEADILTPNITEACILTDTEYKTEGWTADEIFLIGQKIYKMGPKKIVITGIVQGDIISNYCFDASECIHSDYVGKFINVNKVGETRSGTGDVFAAIVTADAVNGVGFEKSVKHATEFITKCIRKSIELNIPTTDGVCFEEVLSELNVK